MNKLLIVDDEPDVRRILRQLLEKEGYEITMYHQDMHHYPDEHLTDYLEKNSFDVVGISIIAGYYQYRKLLKLSEAINRAKNRPSVYMLGGHGPSPEPEFFIKKTGADIIVIGEGEETVKKIVLALIGIIVLIFTAGGKKKDTHN